MKTLAEQREDEERVLRIRAQREYEEHVQCIRAGEIPCDYCNVRLNIPVCPRCLRTDANIPPKQRVKTNA